LGIAYVAWLNRKRASAPTAIVIGIVSGFAGFLYRRAIAKENVEELGALLWTLGASVLASTFGDFVKGGATINYLAIMVLCSLASIVLGIRLRRTK
jgi:multisubunit Na+/H+ antiporter MnhG subunit